MYKNRTTHTLILMSTQLARLEADERALEAAGVPRAYWMYIAANSSGDALGMWTPDRDWILADMVKFPANGMLYTVVDGRDKEAIRAHVGDSWDGHGCWHTQENRPWRAADSELAWNAWRLSRLVLKDNDETSRGAQNLK